ncbi:Zuotin [Pseudocercospora fuligena]|uniref:Zuotin n=1 Tax=Pseudocercospora fuligena TaxID=685502 RepID=A0A8H6RBB5_9PEZI|nr:Zuotin [Pseudocercospora fuligena]
MAAIQLSVALPTLPEGWTAEKDFKPVGHLSEPTQRAIEPVGPHFLAHARRKRHKRTFSEDEKLQAEKNVKKVEQDQDDDIDSDEDPMLLQREAKDWKTQDHYAVLGLTRWRYKATEDQIKRAHRKKVLKHHPDKKAASGQEENDQFFKCIQRATDILLDPVKRRQYDSVDEAADKEPPSKKDVEKKPGNFYKLWAPVFEAEGRFSKKQPVPKIGNDNSTKEEVDEFYNFWYNFDSWRSFEYLDEDVPDDNESRDQKRHVERKNNNARKKRKNEDVQRLRQVVDQALKQDPRPAKFRQEKNKGKLQKQQQKEEAERKAKEEAAKKKEDEEKAAAAKAAEEKAAREDAKKGKEAAKNAAKKNKRVVRGAPKDANYFADGTADASTINSVTNDVDALILKLDNEELADFTAKLQGKTDKAAVKAVFAEEVQRLVGAGKAKDGEMKSIA